MADNHLQAKIEYQIQEMADGQRRVEFQIRARARAPTRSSWPSKGRPGSIPTNSTRSSTSKGSSVSCSPTRSSSPNFWSAIYREQGYLSAEIDEPRYEFQGPLARVVLPVREGPRFTCAARVRVGEQPVFDRRRRLPAPCCCRAEPFRARSLPRTRSRRFATSTGQRATTTSDRTTTSCRIRATGQVDVTFTIAEGRQSVIAGITIEGNDKVSNRLVSRQIQLTTAQPLDLSALARSRRNLYDTGAFSVVDITRRDVDENGRLQTRQTRQPPTAAAIDGTQANQPKSVESQRAMSGRSSRSRSDMAPRTTPNAVSAASSTSPITTRSAVPGRSVFMRATTASFTKGASTSTSPR